MTDIKTKYFVDKINFCKCAECGMSESEIKKNYSLKDFPTRKSIYYLQKFEKHVNEHSLSIKEYCKKHLNFNWPLAIDSLDECGYKFSGRGILISQYKKGTINKNNCSGFKNACEKMAIDRLGENNPMYGKNAWNKNLNKQTDERIASVSRKLTNRKISIETKEKQSIKRREHPLKARHTTPHSDETKQILREKTLKMISLGLYNRETTIEKQVKEFLTKNGVKFEKEYIIDFWCVDFAILESKIAIEVDGDYFHSNPKKYPNGPETNTQKRNKTRDHRKNESLKNKGWKVLRYWESDILDKSYENKIINDINEISKNNKY